MGNKSLVSCESKRSYHFFHEEAAILFLVWKKKKKQSISLSFMVEPEKSNNGPSLFSFTRKQSMFLSHLGKKSYVSSCGKQRQIRRRSNPSLFHCGKQSFVPCGSSSRRRNNHLSLYFSLSLSCGNDPLSHVEAEEEEAIISLTFSLSHV
jgi:hypothetical protein